MSKLILTPEQQAVVDADLDGPRLVDAGAGTGKTFTLVQRAVSLVRRKSLRADELLVVTFTKAVATEIAGRLESELALTANQRPTCGTFHGVASDLLREFAYEAGISPDVRVIDDGRARGVFARAFADLIAGRLDVDVSAFPLLDRPKALERSLASMVLGLKHRGINIPDFMRRASDASTELERIAFGGVQMVKVVRGQTLPKAGWPRPDPLRSPEERHLEAANERSNVDVVAALFAHFQHLLDAENLLTFGDVLTRATHMLRQHPSIVATLRARWKHAIVDEFQDTNDTQIGFLEALFGDDLKPVLVVGDVRQAIYEFAGAQPQGIVDFRQRVREKLPLTVNRRSLQPILDVAHSSLGTLGGVESELNARLKAYRGDALPACVRVELFAGDDALENEAACVAGTIRTLVDGGVSPQRCAVLVRTRTRAGFFAQALRDQGLAVQLHGGVGFFDAPEIREVIAWLRIVDDPTDAFAILAALQSAAIGLSDGAVAMLARNRDLARAALLDAIPTEFPPVESLRLERFRRTARIVCSLADTPLVDAVRTVITASGAEIARVAEAATLLQVRANLEKFLRFAADFAGDRPLARVCDLVNELRERDELELDLPIAELEGDRVAIMTIHGAKGLEWDHVFVADVVSGSFPLVNNDNRDKVAQFDATSGALALKHGVDGRPTLRWYLTQHDHDDCGTVSNDEKPKSAEEFRLLYVALTRARDALYVTGRKSKTNAVSKCFTAVETWAREISGSSEPHRITSPIERPIGLRPLVGAVVDGDLALKLSARVLRSAAASIVPVERRGALSYSAMELYERCPRRARYHYVLGLPDLTDEASSAHVGDEGKMRETKDPARYGRVIHRALELLTVRRLSGDELAPDTALAEALDEEEWEPSDDERRRAWKAIDDAVACLKSLLPIDAERPFEVDLDGVRLAGFIDLIASDNDGTPMIVDYKTGQTPGQHYALQFALYAYAVRTEFPNSAARVLRIAADRASFEAIVPATEEQLRRAVASARTMESEEPRPGPQCTYCPYAHSVCAAAPK
jgi:superfamily I DNA/RNA helicase/RecB family exonuclease